ncbi:ABC transporter ATP-binding protein [Actinomadura atramentaria]|uniref:ABC transporter ATP-binding protein n=1 Tax=Actinomadura atramentaria TaxID=1990 RepID=UPI00037702D2|nr:ATP-binding cassette domain-containing protein [Actinomadura atramentaria]
MPPGEPAADPAELLDPVAPGADGLRVSRVTVRFGGITAVDGASLHVRPASVTGLIGPNGAGKTTLFDVVTGLRRPETGAVLLDGDEVTRAPVHERARRGMARTFQRLEAFGSLTVRENVLVAAEIHATAGRALGRRAARARARDRADELLARTGIADYAAHRADTVPTGTARLLELARALAAEPRVLLLDEPSAGLSAPESAALAGLLRGLAGEGLAVLLVEHDMELVMGVCDTLYVLESGRIIAGGPPERVRADPRVRDAYLGPGEGAA